MTIGKWYFTFGFKIKKEYYLKIRGFVVENLPKEYLRDGLNKNNTQELKDMFDEWVNELCGNVIEDKFSIDGVNFVGRGFTHDNQFENYVVVGIDMGEINRWEATGEVNKKDCKKEILALTTKQEWIEAIQNTDSNCTFYSKLPYGIDDPKFPTFSICPTVHPTTDDCDCCS